MAEPERYASATAPGLQRPRLVIWPAQPQHRRHVIAFIASLSSETRYLRFFHALRQLPDALMTRLLRFEPYSGAALLAFDSANHCTVAGIAQYAAGEKPGHCEIAVVVADAWQRRGVASALLDALAQIAIAGGFHTATAEILGENTVALHLARRRNASLAPVPGLGQLVAMRIPLRPAEAGTVRKAD